MACVVMRLVCSHRFLRGVCEGLTEGWAGVFVLPHKVVNEACSPRPWRWQTLRAFLWGRGIWSHHLLSHMLHLSALERKAEGKGGNIKDSFCSHCSH